MNRNTIPDYDCPDPGQEPRESPLPSLKDYNRPIINPIVVKTSNQKEIQCNENIIDVILKEYYAVAYTTSTEYSINLRIKELQNSCREKLTELHAMIIENRNNDIPSYRIQFYQ